MRCVIPGLGALVALAFTGCGTTSASGRVGSTLSGGGISVTLQRVDLRTPVPSHDITGLSTPAPGDRLIGTRVRVCGNNGAAIGTFNFTISVSGGGAGRVKFPSMYYPGQLQAVGAADHLEHDLVGPGADPVQPQVAPGALDPVLLHVAVAAVDLDALVGDLD
jgi:hypothetical protein